MYLVIILITFCSADILEPNRVSRQIKEFANTFNNFLQSDFKAVNRVPYPGQVNRINVVYKTVEEPIRIEKTIPIPIVKHVPHPVPVYVPQPYPVEKKVFVPYTVYEKQPIPIYHRYPVETKVPVPIHIPLERTADVFVPYHVPIEKRVFPKVPLIAPPQHALLKEVTFPRKTVADLYNFSDTVKFPDVDRSTLASANSEDHVVTEDPGAYPDPESSTIAYTAQNIIPYGTRISGLTNIIEKQLEHPVKKFVEDSVQAEVIKPTPEGRGKLDVPQVSELVNKNESKEAQTINEQNVSDEEGKSKDDESREEKKLIVFPTERNSTSVES